MEHEQYISPRKLAELETAERVAIFDKMVDLALDGVITFEQAVSGYKEECAHIGLPLGPIAPAE